MKNKIAKKALLSCAAIVFWLAIWEIASRIVSIDLILPGVGKVFLALFSLISTLSFWKIILFSLLRITIGFILGLILGSLLAVITNYSSAVDCVLSPFMTVIRATPVASFIMILWLMIGSDIVPTVITVIMVMPIIWQNLKDGFGAVDPALSEVCDMYGFSPSKRFLLLILPTLKKYIIPAIISSVGLAWKSGIAAEIIAYTSNSIGREIFNAKNYLESAEMLAWTMVVIIFSLLFEWGLRLITRRFNGNEDRA